MIDERWLKSIIATLDPDVMETSCHRGLVGFVGVVDGRHNPKRKYDMPIMAL